MLAGCYSGSVLTSVCFLQKINQKNTWELGLIDHLSEIIRVESEDESETNFQKVVLFGLSF